MARNWNVPEAITAIKNGEKENIMDIGKRFPLFAVAAASADLNSPLFEVIKAIPERVSVRVIESAMRDGVTESADDGDDTDETPADKPAAKPAGAPIPKATTAKPTVAGEDDYDTKGTYPLYLLCKERGLEAKSKQDKSVYIETLRAADKKAGNSKKAANVETETPAAEENEYAAMTTQELFKECKKRGIEAEIKKPKDYYINLLTANDVEVPEDETADDDDWGDEKETPAPTAKPAAKPTAKPAAKAKPAAAKPAEDDDWDI